MINLVYIEDKKWEIQLIIYEIIPYILNQHENTLFIIFIWEILMDQNKSSSLFGNTSNNAFNTLSNPFANIQQTQLPIKPVN